MTNLEDDARVPVRRIYLYQFAADFVPIYALYPIMFVAQHFSTFEISVLVASWSLTALLFEVPSGVIADRHDRRLVLAAAQAATFVSLVAWILFPNFWGYLVGFIIWGLGGALHSGTFEALVFDELKAHSVEHKYVRVLGRSEACSLIAVVLSALLAAPLVHWGYKTVLVVSAGASAIALLFALMLPRAARQEDVEDEQYFAMLKRGIHDARVVPGLLRLITAVAAAGAVVDIASEYGPIFVGDAGYKPASVALIAGAGVALMAAASASADRIDMKRFPVPAALVVVGALIVIATRFDGLLAVALYGVAAAMSQLGYVLARADLQHGIESDLRATTTSAAGFGQEAMNFVGLLAFGVLADAAVRSTAFAALGVATIVVALLLAVPARSSRKTVDSGTDPA